MTAVLCTNLYKAAYAAKKASKPVKSLPITSYLKLWTHDGRLLVTPFDFEPEERAKNTATAPAMVDAEFATCVPARAFVDWLKATQNPKAKHGEDRIEIWHNPMLEEVTIKAGNTKATFKAMTAAEFPA